MTFTRDEKNACLRELARCSGRRWVACNRVSEGAWSAFIKLGWGIEADVDNWGASYFRESGTNRIDGNEVALAAAFVVAA